MNDPMGKVLIGLATLFICATGISGCSTQGPLGMVAKSSVDPVSLLRSGRPHQELGPVQGSACHYSFGAAFGVGDSDISKAVEDALKGTEGDVLVDVTTTKSHIGLWPGLGLLERSCTTVEGTAVDLK